MLPFQLRLKLKSCNMQLLNAPRCALVPMEFKFHLYWILAVRWHCFISRISTNISCQKLNQQQVRRLMLIICLNYVANDEQMPIKMYIELHLSFLGLKVLNVGVLIAEEVNQVFDKKHQTRLAGIVGWNLIWDNRIWLIYVSWRSQSFVIFPIVHFSLF